MFAIQVISALSGLSALLIGYKTRNILWYYVVFSLLCDILGLFVKQDWFANTFIGVEFVLISTYFLQELVQKKYQKPVAILVGIVVCLFFISSVDKGWLHANYKDGAVLYALIIPWLILGYYKIISQTEEPHAERIPLFAFTSGFMLYVGSLIIFIVAEKLRQTDRPWLLLLWKLHDILNVIKNLCIAYGLYLMKPGRRV